METDENGSYQLRREFIQLSANFSCIWKSSGKKLPLFLQILEFHYNTIYDKFREAL